MSEDDLGDLKWIFNVQDKPAVRNERTSFVRLTNLVI